MSALASIGLPYPFERDYMELALLAGGIVGATAPLVGTFLVQKRLSLMGDGIGHLAFALVFYGGIAAAVVIASRTDSGTVNVLPYLFGSILTVSHDDVRVIL